MARSPDPTVVAGTVSTVVAGDGEARNAAIDEDAPRGFRVTLDDFDGPFDLLLRLITQRELDITEVSLSAVTDEFLAYLRALEAEDQLETASEFLVVAVTLLDMKIASLLPQGELVDAEDVRAARGARPALRSPAAVSRVQGSERLVRRALRDGGASPRALGAARRPVPAAHTRTQVDPQS